MKTSFLLIGAGHMGSSLLKGFVRARVLRASAVHVVDHHAEQRRVLKKLGVTANAALRPEDIKNARTIIIAVKPQDAVPVLAALRAHLMPQTLVLSIMAGVSVTRLAKTLHHARVIRIMPNLPVSLGLGVNILLPAKGCTRANRTYAEKLFRSVGVILRAKNDRTVDRMAAMSGCGPGYVFAFAAALEEAAHALGLSPHDANLLVRETVAGSAQLYHADTKSAATLARAVASPGGMTEKAFQVLKKRGMSRIWKEALRAAYTHAEKLARARDNA